MKSKKQIYSRLKRLYFRYLKKYVIHTQKRICVNCKYCESHVTKPLIYDHEPVAEYELYPTHVSTTFVVNPKPGPISLCMYGAENPAEWKGDICNNEVAKGCKLFVPCLSIQEAQEQFNELMNDDDWVLKHHNDIAILQWILDNRIVHDLTWLDRFLIWIKSKFVKPDPFIPQLPPPDIPEDFWDDPSSNSGT
jgi:hypothetical protein